MTSRHLEMKQIIEKAFSTIHARRSADDFSPDELHAMDEIMDELEMGTIRVVGKESDGTYRVNEWVKKAVLLEFRRQPLKEMGAGGLHFLDRIRPRRIRPEQDVRVVPPAIARRGSFLGRKVVLMPSFVNIGAYVGEGTMVDTWATVGSCAQIGKGVHLSGGVGIGGVLEPLQASPVIIEDHAFIGSRAIIVEGVLVGEGAVIGAGVVLTSSTRVIDVTGSSPVEFKRVIPARSVVIPGTRPKQFPAGEFGVPCALIIGQRSASTDEKTSLNQVLRDFELPT